MHSGIQCSACGMLFQEPQQLNRHQTKFCAQTADVDSLQTKIDQLAAQKKNIPASSHSSRSQQGRINLRKIKAEEQQEKGVNLQLMLTRIAEQQRIEIEKRLEKQSLEKQFEHLQDFQRQIAIKRKQSELEGLRDRRSGLIQEQEQLLRQVRRMEQQAKQKSNKFVITAKQERKPGKIQIMQNGLFEKGIEVQRIRQQRENLLKQKHALEYNLDHLKANPNDFIKQYAADQRERPTLASPTYNEPLSVADNLKLVKQQFAGRPQAEERIAEEARRMAEKASFQNKVREQQIEYKYQEKPDMLPKERLVQHPYTNSPFIQHQSFTKHDRKKQEKVDPLSVLAQQNQKEIFVKAKQIKQQGIFPKRQIQGDIQGLADKAEALHISGKNASTPSQNLLYMLTCQEIDQLKILETLTPGTPIYQFRYQVYRKLQMQRLGLYQQVQRARIDDIRRQAIMDKKISERNEKEQEYVDEQRKKMIMNNMEKDIQRLKRGGSGKVHFLYFVSDQDYGEIRISSTITDLQNQPLPDVSTSVHMASEEDEYIANFQAESRTFHFNARRGGSLNLKIQARNPTGFYLIGWTRLDLKTQDYKPLLGNHRLIIFKPPFLPTNVHHVSPKPLQKSYLYIQITDQKEQAYYPKRHSMISNYQMTGEQINQHSVGLGLGLEMGMGGQGNKEKEQEREVIQDVKKKIGKKKEGRKDEQEGENLFVRDFQI